MSEATLHEMNQLRERLQEAVEAWDDYDGEASCIGVEYCIECDEINLIVNQDSGEYRHLDCRLEHPVLEDGHAEVQMTAWIDCITHFLGDDGQGGEVA